MKPCLHTNFNNNNKVVVKNEARCWYCLNVKKQLVIKPAPAKDESRKQ